MFQILFSIILIPLIIAAFWFPFVMSIIILAMYGLLEVMIEVKPRNEIDMSDVQAKKTTAEEYCKVVNKSIDKFGIVKPWRYKIIPTDKITIQSTVNGLLN